MHGLDEARTGGREMPIAMTDVRKGAAWLLVCALGVAVASCSGKPKLDPFAGKGSPKYSGLGPLPKGGGRRHVGKPYVVAGRKFYPTRHPKRVQVGVASWYGPKFHRRKTSNGEWFDMNYLSAAHPTMPLPSYVKVTNLENGRTVVVRVNDRGPFVGTRIIDLSRAAAKRLDFLRKGKAKVRVEYLGDAPLGDDRRLLARLNRMSRQPAWRIAAAIRGRHVPPRPVAVAAGPMDKAMTPPVEVAGLVAAPRRAVAAPGYFVQVATFSDPANAEALRRRLAAHGPVRTEAVEINGARYVRVRMGPFASRDDAALAKARAAEAGLPGARIVITPAGG